MQNVPNLFKLAQFKNMSRLKVANLGAASKSRSNFTIHETKQFGDVRMFKKTCTNHPFSVRQKRQRYFETNPKYSPTSLIHSWFTKHLGNNLILEF